MTDTVSAVIPTYRGADTLPELVERLTTVLKARKAKFEILIVDDASPDNGRTWSAVTDLARKHSHVHGFRLLRNRGQHNALLLGIREASFETIVTMDDDLQNPPEEVPRLVAQLHLGHADVVYGVPRKKQHGLLQNIGSRSVQYALTLVLGATHARGASSFRAFRTVLRDSFSWHQSPRVSIDALLGWGATRYSTIDVDHNPRTQGRSGYDLRRLIGHSLTMITSYSTVPLRIASLTGLVFVVLGLGVVLYVIIGRMTGYVTEPGFTFLVSLISIIGGGQLLALGIVGEYLSTIFMRSLGMPSYTLAEKTGTKSEA